MGLAVCQFINNFIHKYTKARSDAGTLSLLLLVKKIVIFTIIMFPQALISPPPVSSLFSASAIVAILIYICVITFSLLLSLIAIVIFYMIWDFFFFPQSRQSRQSDLESGDEQRLYEPDVNYDSVEWHEQEVFYQAAVLHNMRVLEILDRVIEELEERKKRRQKRERRRALEKKLLPTVCYGSHESEIHCKDCAICLQEFETGDMCQVLPSCNHTFHSKCINHWLRENLTCPICRNRVIDL